MTTPASAVKPNNAFDTLFPADKVHKDVVFLWVYTNRNNTEYAQVVFRDGQGKWTLHENESKNDERFLIRSLDEIHFKNGALKIPTKNEYETEYTVLAGTWTREKPIGCSGLTCRDEDDGGYYHLFSRSSAFPVVTKDVQKLLCTKQPLETVMQIAATVKEIKEKGPAYITEQRKILNQAASFYSAQYGNGRTPGREDRE